MPNITVVYDLRFSDGTSESLSIAIDAATLRYVPGETTTPPSWTKLDHHQCEHCPLSPKEVAFCPVAVNLSQIENAFKSRTSFDEVDAVVRTAERHYQKKLPLQRALNSIFGLIMATSECPYMNFMRPMARFH